MKKKVIGNAILYCGDCEEVLSELKEIDACVTDPPYGLSFMGNKWDYDVPNKEIWEKVYNALKPGAHLLSFFGSRTYHRGVIPIEDAGFDIRDQIMWLYGSGFPKSHNIGKAVDKLQGNKREVVGDNPNARKAESHKKTIFKSGLKKEGKITKGNSEWEGWGTALKPAHEPIVMARKPFKGSVVNNVLEHGTGGINIDESKIEYADDNDRSGWHKTGGGGKGYQGTSTFKIREISAEEIQERTKAGRFPANVIHDGSKEVIEGFPDEGATARYFYTPKTSRKERNEGLDHLPDGAPQRWNKAGTWTDDTTPAKNNHPTVKPLALMKYLCKLVTPKDRIILDPFMGSGSTGLAALEEGFKFIGIEREEKYFDIACARLQHFVDNQKTNLENEFGA